MKQSRDSSPVVSESKRGNYVAPQLKRYGSVADLTKGSGGSLMDGNDMTSSDHSMDNPHGMDP